MAYDAACPGDEVEDLFELLRDVKEQFPEVQAVSSGAVLSTYQRLRVENVCARLGLTSLAYLWQRPQDEVLDSMVQDEVEAVLVKVASMGLKPAYLGRTIQDLQPTFEDLHEQFGFHVCGEGGEYETVTLDCPLFKRRIVLDEVERIMVDDVPFAPVAVLHIKALHTQAKPDSEPWPPSDATSAAQPPQPPRDAHGAVEQTSTAVTAFPPEPTYSTSGTLAFVSGCRAPDGCEDAVIGVQSACETLARVLGEHGQTLRDVAFVSLTVADMTQFGAVNAAYCGFFEGFPAPSRACVEASLPAGCHVCISAVVAKEPRAVLHVRSISKWAPVCIGPYAQCNMLADKTCVVAGQIALDPASMVLAHESDAAAQLELALKHCLAILSCQESQLAHAIQMVVYVARGASLDVGAELAKNKTLGAPPPFVVVEVPALPRGAAVEVEMVATHDEPGAVIVSERPFCRHWERATVGRSAQLFALAASDEAVDAAALSASVQAAQSSGRVAARGWFDPATADLSVVEAISECLGLVIQPSPGLMVGPQGIAARIVLQLWG